EKVSQLRISLGEIQKRGRADEGKIGSVLGGKTQQVISTTLSHQASRFGEHFRVWWFGAWRNTPGGEDQPHDTWVLLFHLVSANFRPASAVSNHHHLLESSIRGEVDPGGEVSYFLTGHTPITAAAEWFSAALSGDVCKVMHARISADAGI